jgi:hypothetical protein
MKTRKAIALSLFLVGTLLICTSLSGIAVAEDVTVDLTVPLSGTMTFQTSDQSGSTHGSAPFTANFDDTVTVGSDTTNTAAVDATVQTNSSSWSLTQDISDNELYNTTDTASLHLQWEEQGQGGGFTNMITTGEEVGSGSAPTGGANFVVDYQVQVGWTDPNGIYEGTVAYTFTPN